MSDMNVIASDGVESVVNQTRRVLSGLETQPDLHPRPEVNALFNHIVGISGIEMGDGLTAMVLEDLAADGALDRLRGYCAHGEACMEAHWAGLLAEAEDVEACLQTFPYLAEYKTLTAQEMRLVRREAPHLRRVLFAGSGPLPLSAYLMARDHGCEVDMLDCEPHAHHCAMSWLRRLPVTPRVRFLHGDIRDMELDGMYDAVVLASLAGADEADKQAIVRSMAGKMHAGQVLVARSAHGLRRLLYMDTPEEMFGGFDVREVWHPQGECVNSLVVAVK